MLIEGAQLLCKDLAVTDGGVSGVVDLGYNEYSFDSRPFLFATFTTVASAKAATDAITIQHSDTETGTFTAVMSITLPQTVPYNSYPSTVLGIRLPKYMKRYMKIMFSGAAGAACTAGISTGVAYDG